jgi:hypothetical protein
MVGKALAFITVTALLFASASFAPDQARCAYTVKSGKHTSPHKAA